HLEASQGRRPLDSRCGRCGDDARARGGSHRACGARARRRRNRPPPAYPAELRFSREPAAAWGGREPERVGRRGDAALRGAGAEGCVMKAVLAKAFGPPEQLVLEEVPPRRAGPGEVVIKVKACGVNFFDALIVQGKYQTRPPLPFSPGGEVAGVVSEVG